MTKFKVAILAIFDGLLLATATGATVLGFIHSISTSAEYILLMLTPVPVIWLHTRINKYCDKIQGLDGGEE